MMRNAYLGSRLIDQPIADFQKFRRMNGALEGGGQLLFGRFLVDAIRRQGAVRQYGHDVVDNLDKAPIDIETALDASRADTHFAKTQPSNHGAMARQNAKFAIVKRQHHRLGLIIQRRLFGCDDDAIQKGQGWLVSEW